MKRFACFLFFIASSLFAADDLGRLLLTPEERQIEEEKRQAQQKANPTTKTETGRISKKGQKEPLLRWEDGRSTQTRQNKLVRKGNEAK